MTEWKPIKTAPKDGSWIITARYDVHPNHTTALWWLCMGRWSEKYQSWNEGIAGFDDPTHWMPMPQPPKELA